MAAVVECRARLEHDAITLADIERCRRRVQIGDSFRIRVIRDENGFGRKTEPVIIRAQVTGKYRHIVTLDCGTSVTYVQIIQYQRRRGRDKYIR